LSTTFCGILFFGGGQVIGGTGIVHIGKNAENEVDLIKSFSVLEWIFWEILFF
jgi:hypothetical protein